MNINNKYGTGPLQYELLQIMVEFHDFCVKKGIKYSLYGGSCLGAVRHSGFIPWDDDLDVVMDRENMEKFLNVQEDMSNLRAFVYLWTERVRRKENAMVNNTKPTLDVFVMDNAPNSRIMFKYKLFLLGFLQGMIKKHLKYKKRNLKDKVLVFLSHSIGKLFSEEKKNKMYARVSQIGNTKKTRYIHCTSTSFLWLKNTYKNDLLDSLVLHEFEGYRFFIMENYHEYLTKCYGDYMQLPPEKERKPIHM